MSRHITLLFPPSFSSIVAQLPQIQSPVLALILSRSDCLNTSFNTYQQIVEDKFVLEKGGAGAVAAIETYAQTGFLDRDWKCVATPVMLVPNREHLQLMQSSGFDIDQSEMNSYAAEMNHYFTDDGLTFGFTTNNQWICTAESQIDVSQANPADILGQNIVSYIPTGENKMQWRKFFNELQMLMHHSAANKQHIQKNKPEFNSIWLWGGGELPKLQKNQQLSFFADDDYIKGLAKLADAEFAHMPDNFDIKQSNRNELFYVFNEFQSKNDMEELEHSFMQPLLVALNKGKVQSVTLYLSPETGFKLTNRQLSKFWKRKQPIQDFINS